MNHIFPKPFPRASARTYKNRQFAYLHKAVPKEKSIYFYWFQFLRRSEKYRKACTNSGIGMKNVYRDFGDVFSVDFWEWWFTLNDDGLDRGCQLFAHSKRSSVELVDELPCEIKDHSRDRYTLSVSKRASISEVIADLKKIGIGKAVSSSKTALTLQPKYSPNSVKVDVPSLAKCLRAFDMYSNGQSLVAIGAVAQGLDQKRDKEFFENYELDYRKMKRFKDSDGISAKDVFGKKISMYDKGVSDLRSRPRTRSVHSFYGREKKVYLISNAHRLIQKAKANIAGVEKGVFPLPHGVSLSPSA